MSADLARPFDAASDAKYVLLTTFRKDGTPVGSPLWAALDEGRLYMWTVADSWKVKRIRRDPRVTVAACDRTGKKSHGATVTATAQILDAAGTAKTHALIRAKYVVLGWVGVTVSALRRGKTGTVGLMITVST